MLEEFSAAISQFHFLRPLWLFGLLPAVLLPLTLFYQQIKMGSWHAVINPDFQPYLLNGKAQKNASAPFYLLALVWLAATLLLAGPTWQKLPQEVHKKVDARIILLDQSYSMLATDIKPDRNTRAKHKLADLLNKFEEGTTALIVYAGDAHVVTPLTEDTNTIANLAPSLTPLIMPVAGNNLIHAAQKAQQLLNNAQLSRAKLYLLTDGIEENQLKKVNQLFNGLDITVNVLGIGTTEGAPIPTPDGSFLKDNNGAIALPKLNRPALLKLANQHGGHYSDIKSSDEDIEYLIKERISYEEQTLQATERQFDIWQEEGPWLLLFLMPLIALAFRKGWIGQLLLPVFFFSAITQPNVGQAGIWQDLWSTKDQQGAKAFQAQDWQTAAEHFNAPQWKGSSHYRNNNYQQAAEEFAQDNNPTSLYNQGNALAKAGQLEEAVEAYEQSLNLAPNHEDAQFNLDLVKKILEQQNSEQNSENGQDKQNQDNQNQEQQNQDQQNDPSQDQNNGNSQDNNTQDNKPSEKKPNEKNNPSEDEENKNKLEQDAAEEKEPEEKDQAPEDKNEPQEQQAEEIKERQESASAEEREKALQQWLGRIPDNPGGLLKQKFLYESQTAPPETEANGKPW